MGLRSASAWAASVELADFSNVALLQRLRNCEAWLEHLVGQLLAGAPVAHGRRIRLIDGTTVPKASRTAKQNNGLWRLHCAFDLPAERFSFFALTDETGGEQLDRVPVAEGDILIAGKRTFIVSVKRSLPVSCIPTGWGGACEQGADIVVRAGWKSARWLDGKGKPFNLLAALAAAGRVDVLDRPIWIGRRKAPPLALRLVAFRKPAAATEISRAKARRAAQREGNTILGGTLAAAEWVILVTSLKADAWSSVEIGELYRARWRIEMAFKRLKSILGLRGRLAKTRRWPRPPSSRGQAMDPGSSPDGAFARAAYERARGLSPLGRITAPALWRLTCLVAKALLAAIMPWPIPQTLDPTQLRRHLMEPTRTRCYQTITALC